MKMYIESMPLDSERKANKLIHICEERDLLEQGKFCSHRVHGQCNPFKMQLSVHGFLLQFPLRHQA